MKKLAFIFLICLFLWVSIQQVGVVIYFKYHQKEIEARFCENKDKPQLNCHGKCSLKRELEKTTSEQKKWEYMVIKFLPIILDDYELIHPQSLSIYYKIFHREILFESLFLSKILKPPLSKKKSPFTDFHRFHRFSTAV